MWNSGTQSEVLDEEHVALKSSIQPYQFEPRLGLGETLNFSSDESKDGSEPDLNPSLENSDWYGHALPMVYYRCRSFFYIVKRSIFVAKLSNS